MTGLDWAMDSVTEIRSPTTSNPQHDETNTYCPSLDQQRSANLQYSPKNIIRQNNTRIQLCEQPFTQMYCLLIFHSNN